MILYHGTSKENWEKIQQEGILWGRRYILNSNGSIKKEVDRCTYLAVDKEEAKQYGDVLLEVEYEPSNSKHNNYCEGCWQVRVYEPIPLSQIKNLTIERRKSMSKRAEEAAMKAYPKTSRLSEPHGVIPADNRTHYLGDANEENRQAFCKGYEQAQKDTIEMACQLLYDYNRQMAEMYGEKAVLSCSQFTIDVERFRKTLIIE